MPQMRNTITGKVNWMPASYVGQYPFVVVEETPEPVVVVEPAPKKKKAKYVPNAIDSDGDGRVQDGTPFEREVGTELSPEQVTAIEAQDSE